MHDRIKNEFSLLNRVAVVTGAASGIGRETAILLTQAGAHVVAADVDQVGLAETASLIGDSITTKVTDVANRDAVDALAETAIAKDDRIDIWINVAGTLKQFNVVDTVEKDLDEIIAVNLKGTYWGCAAAGRIMTAQRSGSIINVSSNGGDSSPAGLSAYAATKAGVNALTRSLAKELGPFGIRANTVSPGFVETTLARHSYTDADGTIDESRRQAALEKRRAASPLGITGEPSDIAFAILYLAAEASRFITGQTLRPNGGVWMG